MTERIGYEIHPDKATMRQSNEAALRADRWGLDERHALLFVLLRDEHGLGIKDFLDLTPAQLRVVEDAAEDDETLKN